MFGILQIEADDGLPQNVCQKCVTNIRAAFVYRQKCEQSDAELRELFQKQFSNDSVKLEVPEEVKASDDTEFVGSSKDHWFIAIESENMSEIDLKTEDARSCSGFEDPAFDFESTSAHSFDEEIAGNDEKIDIVDEIHNEHERTDANSENKYTCNICSKVFNRKYNWKQHKLVHSDEKNFKCTVCSQEYKSENNLK